MPQLAIVVRWRIGAGTYEIMTIVKTWYTATPFSDGVTRIHEHHVASWLRCNIWHVRGRDRDLIIDTGMGLRPLKAEIVSLSERPLTAIVTHCHFDHSGGLHEFEHRCGHHAEANILSHPTVQNTGVDFGYVRADTVTALPYEGFDYRTYSVVPAPLTGYLDDGDVIDLGDRVFKVLHVPGHSPGSIALFEAATGILFSGDAIYDGDLLDNLYHSNAEHMLHSLMRLKQMPIELVHGGHYASFDRERMQLIIDEYRSGGRRIGDPSSWIEDENTS